MKKRSFSEKMLNFLNSKGFYIALALCVCAIGASCWYLWQGFTLARDMARETASAQPVTVTPASAEPDASDPAEESDDTSDPADEEPEDAEGNASPAEAGKPEEFSEPTAQEPASETVEPVANVPAEPPQPTAAEDPGWLWPLEGDVVAAFSATTLTYNNALGDWRTHSGIDLSAQEGQQVVAAHSGTVCAVEDDPLLGRTVVLDCGGGISAVYGNLSADVFVTAGEPVSAGDPIGTVGETAMGERNEAAWLHFSLEKDGEAVDPAEYLN